jgi:hypothetical protein
LLASDGAAGIAVAGVKLTTELATAAAIKTEMDLRMFLTSFVTLRFI